MERLWVCACKALSMAVVGGLSLTAATINNTNYPTFPMVVGSNTVYQFDIAISSGEQIAPGDFFRIFDFGGLTGTPTAPAGWNVSVSNSNPPPPPNVILSYGDDPALPNITFTYTNSTPIGGASDVTGFEAISTEALSNTALKDGAALTTLSTVLSNSGSTSSINAVLVPGAAAAVPEPTSLYTAGTALLLAGLRLFHTARRRP